MPRWEMAECIGRINGVLLLPDMRRSLPPALSASSGHIVGPAVGSADDFRLEEGPSAA